MGNSARRRAVSEMAERKYVWSLRRSAGRRSLGRQFEDHPLRA